MQNKYHSLLKNVDLDEDRINPSFSRCFNGNMRNEETYSSIDNLWSLKVCMTELDNSQKTEMNKFADFYFAMELTNCTKNSFVDFYAWKSENKEDSDLIKKLI